ncbi:MAG: hypothetical protein P4L33_21055 [Capsulimonadaceae bacterium]|nr:hypothetical protein [Capsulimonadaceae bacterium]
MPETFDLDDDSYDPLGIGSQPAQTPAAPAGESNKPAPPQPEGEAAPPTGAVQRPSTAPARPPGTGPTGPPTTGGVRPPGAGPAGPPSSGRVGGAPTGSLPSRHPTGAVTSGGSAAGPATGRPTTAGGSPTQVGVPPHTKASDLLRGHPNYKAQESPDGRPMLPALTGERPMTKADDIVRGLLTFALFVSAGCMIYYLYGLFSGTLSQEMYGTFNHDDRARIITNLDNTHTVMTYGLLVAVACMCFLFYDEAMSAYALVGVALFLQILMPIVSSQYFALARTAPSDASNHLIANLTEVAWIPGIPGVVLLVMEILRHFVTGLEEQRMKRKHLTYGQGIVKSEKLRNVFLGSCWNMPFCREKIRSKCPIFLQRRGPCWRNKRGCMCDETIVLQANSGEWRQSVNAAKQTLEGSTQTRTQTRVQPPSHGAGQQLSAAFKRERCRQCVIYNTHQEQKYKALVVVALLAVVYGLYQYSGFMLTEVAYGYHWFDNTMAHMSFDPGHGGPVIPHHKAGEPDTPNPVIGAGADLSGPVGWIVLTIVAMFVISKVLQVIEYACFKIKI